MAQNRANDHVKADHDDNDEGDRRHLRREEEERDRNCREGMGRSGSGRQSIRMMTTMTTEAVTLVVAEAKVAPSVRMDRGGGEDRPSSCRQRRSHSRSRSHDDDND